MSQPVVTLLFIYKESAKTVRPSQSEEWAINQALNSHRVCLQVILVQIHVCPHAAVAVQALALILVAAHEEFGSATLALARAAGLWHHSPQRQLSESRRAIARQHSACAAAGALCGHGPRARLCPTWSLWVWLRNEYLWMQVKNLSQANWMICTGFFTRFPWASFTTNHTSAPKHKAALF